MKISSLLLNALLVSGVAVSSATHPDQLPVDTPEKAASIVAVGRVDRVYDRTLFRIRDVDTVSAPHTLLVTIRNPTIDIRPGELVSVTGPVRTFSPETLATASEWKGTPALLEELRGMPLMLASAVVAAAEPIPGPETPLLAPLAEPHAIMTRPTMLSASLGSMAGLYVRLEQSRIAEAVAPRVFIVEERDRGAVALGEGRVLVITAVAAPDVREGLPVEVIGSVYTLAGARALPVWPQDLSGELLDAFERYPVLIADTIRTPGGVVLYGGRR